MASLMPRHRMVTLPTLKHSMAAHLMPQHLMVVAQLMPQHLMVANLMAAVAHPMEAVSASKLSRTVIKGPTAMAAGPFCLYFILEDSDK